MKIIAKTPTGYLIEATVSEVRVMTAGELSEYNIGDHRPCDHTGRVVNVIPMAQHIKTLKDRAVEANKAAKLIHAFADHLEAAIPDITAEPAKEGASE